MKELESGSFSTRPLSRKWPETIRVVSWNINRGLQFNGVVKFLSASSPDLILLQETDINARRTARRNIPREIAQALRMNYIFGREFEELSQGTRTNPAYHGQATLSRLPLLNARILRFPDQSTFWRPRWFVPPLPCFQRRLGGRMALICEIPVKDKTLLVHNVHLESRGSDELRLRQLSAILAEVREYPVERPVLIAGDFNFDISRGPAVSLTTCTGTENPFSSCGGARTILKNRDGKPPAIDWMLTRGEVAGCRPAIHDLVAASDHFPLSLEMRLNTRTGRH